MTWNSTGFDWDLKDTLWHTPPQNEKLLHMLLKKKGEFEKILKNLKIWKFWQEK